MADRRVGPRLADLASVAHDGKVIVVGTGADGTLHYTVRQSGFEDSAIADAGSSIDGFEPWETVPLDWSRPDPSVVANEKANLTAADGTPVLRSRYDSAATRSLPCRVKLISGRDHLYLFRITADHRLVMNRFVLDGMTNELIPKLEVRYRRSGQRLVPDGGHSGTGAVNHDTLGFRDQDQKPFYEPTLELSLLGTFDPAAPWFSVELVPTAEHERHRWNFFVYVGGQLRLVSVAASAEGLIDPTDQTKSQPDPDKVDRKIIRTVPGIVDRRLMLPGSIAGPFDSCLYHNQVERRTKAGDQLLKENTRIMLSVPVRPSAAEAPVVAAVSFAVNNLGQAAQIDRTANADQRLIGDSREVLLPLSDLEDITLIADRTPPPEGTITALAESEDQKLSVHTDRKLNGDLSDGQQVKLSGTRSYDGVYTATKVDDTTFEVPGVFSANGTAGSSGSTGASTDQGYWEAIEDDDSGLVFENMIARYEPTASGGLKITCVSHNISDGDEIRISGSGGHDGTFQVSDVGQDNSFELDIPWPNGEVINLSRRPRRGLAFDGKGDYLLVEDVTTEPHASNARLERTVSAWVNLTAVTGRSQTVFTARSGLCQLSVDRYGKATFALRFADGHRAKVVDKTPLPTQSWVHLSARFDYEGETTGDTTLSLSRGGIEVAAETVSHRKPLHLPIRNLRLRNTDLPITTVQYAMNRAEAVTAEAWISTRKNGKGDLLCWTQNGRFLLSVEGDRSKRVVTWATGDHTLTGDVHLTNDDWHHIVGTYNPTTGERQIIVNGVVDVTGTGPADVGAAAMTARRDLARVLRTPVSIGYLGSGWQQAMADGLIATGVTGADGNLAQVGYKRWQRYDGAGTPVDGELDEVARSKDRIILQDEDRTYRIDVDITNKTVEKVRRNVVTDVHRITAATAKDPSTITEIVAVSQYNEWSTYRAETDGSWTVQGLLVWDAGRHEVVEQTAERIRLRSQGGNNITIDLVERTVTPASRIDSIVGGTGPVTDARYCERIETESGFWVGGTDAYHRFGTELGIWRPDGNRYQYLVVKHKDERYIRIGAARGRHAGIEFDLKDMMQRSIQDVVRETLFTVDEVTTLTDDPATDDRFDGFVADIRVWNRVRSVGQITKSATDRLTGTETGLIAHWALAETGARELPDLTKSMAHISVPDGERLDWFVEPHRAPGVRGHYEGVPYDESYVIGSDLDDRNRHIATFAGGSHLTVPAMNDDLSGGFTVMAWARWDAFNNWSRVIDFGQGQHKHNIVFANRATTNGLVIWTPDGSLEASAVLSSGRWIHVAATITPDGDATLYVDGKAVATGPMPVPPTLNRSRNLIGKSAWPEDGSFHGAIRDLQLWGRALAPNEIKYYQHTPAQGTEEGLYHHWPMRTATIRGKKQVVDQGMAKALHATMVGDPVLATEKDTGPPTPLTEFAGKISDVQLWDVNRPLDTVRQTMHDLLTGQEYGLVGSWRCGGIVTDDRPEVVAANGENGSGETSGADTELDQSDAAAGHSAGKGAGVPTVRRISPDFGLGGNDAVVIGDVYVSARELPRSNSVGRAVRYRNDDLVAVTQRGRYRETFDFRAVTQDGEFLTAADVANADGRGGPLFEFTYWGRSSRTSTDTITFAVDQAFDFEPLGDGWFRANCEVTIPDGVNLIRCFDIAEVTGLWADGAIPPFEEWLSLEVRKHRLELISDSVTRRSFVDQIELPTLVENASTLERMMEEIPILERRAAGLRNDLSRLLEALVVFSQSDRYREELSALVTSTAKLRTEIADIDQTAARHRASPLRHYLWLRGAADQTVIHLTHDGETYLFTQHPTAHQLWVFERRSDGTHQIVNAARPNLYLTDRERGKALVLTGSRGADARWTVDSVGGGRYRVTNVESGRVIDAAGGKSSIGTQLISWPYHGGNNQHWHLDSFFDVIKPTQVNEQSTILAPRKDKDDALAEQTKRLTWLRGVLSDLSADRKTALEQLRGSVSAQLQATEMAISGRNTDYIAAAVMADDAQTMALVAEDALGLKTYGAILSFASPAGGVTSSATAEGNVQLSYFDSRGRFRFTDYDATASKDNASYEEWLPDTVAVCPELAADTSVLRLEGGGAIPIAGPRHTTEAWFYYPPPTSGSSGHPFPVSHLTSDADGAEATIALADGRRLGTVADGFFHDAGIDLASELDHGWHHVAARMDGAAVEYFLDGEPLSPTRADTAADAARDTDDGDQTGGAQAGRGRFAVALPGGPLRSTVSSLQLQKPIPANAFENGFTVQCWARFASVSSWNQIIDFGNGNPSDNVVVGNYGSTRTLTVGVYNGATRKKAWVTSPEVIADNTWMNIAVTIGNKTAVVYVDGREVVRGDCEMPSSVARSRNYLGLSNWHATWDTNPFHGDLSDVRVWGRALTGPEVANYAHSAPPSSATGLLHHWPMRLAGGAGTPAVVDIVGDNPATITGGTVRELSPRPTKPVVAFGNRAGGGAPAGKLAELRLWSAALTDEEIRIHSRLKLNGNEPDLIAYYPMDDVLGAEPNARDRTGANPQAEPTEMTPVARTAPIGHPGATVARFDGTASQSVQVADVNLVDRDFTVEFWAKRDEVGRREWVISQGSRVGNAGLHIGFTEDNEAEIGFYDWVTLRRSLGEPTDAVNRWVHVAASYDASTRRRTLYVDGKRLGSDTAADTLRSTGPLVVGFLFQGELPLRGLMAEVRVWDHVRSASQVVDLHRRRLGGDETGLIVYLPLDDRAADGMVSSAVAGGGSVTATDYRSTRSDDLPIVPGPSLVTAEYSTVGVDPVQADKKRAVLRRFYGYADDGGGLTLLPGRKVEQLRLRWIGNAQFEPTLLGYIEGAPPVPSENLTINYDYDSATSVELVQSDEVFYSWSRNRELATGLDINTFLGVAWSTSGGAFIETKIAEGHLGARATMNAQQRDSESSMVRASSTDSSRDRLDLRGSFETNPKFPNLGNRYVPKNVGYALVISGMADVYVTQTARTGRMVAYEIQPVEDMPPDVNTITFLLNPAYTLNGSLDGMVGSQAADPRFYRHVPEMRAQYGSRYPASYFNLRQAYDLKAQIERWDKQRESYFANFDATEHGLGDEGFDDRMPDPDDAPDSGVDVDAANEDGGDTKSKNGTTGDGTQKKKKGPTAKEIRSRYAGLKKSGARDIKGRMDDIDRVFSDTDKVAEANTAFASWQRRMESLQLRAGKRNIFNTYVWDADGGIRFEEQSFANTIEHTIGGTFSVNATLGGDGAIHIGGFKGELQAMTTREMSQTMSKTESSTRSFELNVRLDGIERKGITDADDYPINPGEKVDRYRFMSFYLEGDVDHFTDFFDYVVDPEWLMSNDEEARALRQVARGRPNKTWRVLHRVTYVERPALMGIGTDQRTTEDLAKANQEVFNYFDALEQRNEELRSDLDAIGGQIERVAEDVKELKDKPPQPAPAGTPASTIDLTDGSSADVSTTSAATANGAEE